MKAPPSGIAYATAAAALFGASTPLAKGLLGTISPVLLAGMLYAGSGLGLGAWLLLRRLRGDRTVEAPLFWRDAPWLGGAVLFGGVLGPVLLMIGLARTPASTTSLLLNLESVLTALIAWTVFRENVDRRIALGMFVIVAGGVLLGGDPDSSGATLWGVLAIAGACLCWAIDNNLTRAVSGGDPVHIAAIKGGVAGSVNIVLALILGAEWPTLATTVAAGVIGLLGYGVSLVLFVLALRHLGTARTGAYFSTAPFVGATLSLLLLHEVPSVAWWMAGTLMAIGVWLHVSERHEHEHTHEPLDHDHLHRHDEHHQHAHDFDWDGTEPHTHRHVHTPMTHRHPHFPDLHHRHGHRGG
ncbi:MAG: EamA family transporter [Dokdonella sp.]